MKKALVIGIDEYPVCPLKGCVNDARAIADKLETNGDGSPNFAVKLLTSDKEPVTTVAMERDIGELFNGNADTVVLYFSGHGIINTTTNAGHIVSQDGKKAAWGISLADLLGMANGASPRIKSTVIILDCCHSGFAGEIPALGNQQISAIGDGVTILTASERDQAALESNGHGLFTGLVLEGLAGAAADVLGRVTPAALYSLVDQTLGPWSQRPIYKANVQTFVTLRQVTPKIPADVLRRLPTYFPDAASTYQLDPSYERDRSKFTQEQLAQYPENKVRQAIFAELQQYNRQGLVVPVGEDHMYFAAMNSKPCRLTALGAHYRKLAELKRIF